MQALAVALTLVAMIVATIFLTVAKVWWFAPLASNWGSLDTLIVITFAVTGLALVGVNLFIAYSVYYHRAQKGRKAVFFVDNPRLEWGLIAATTVGIVVLLGPGLYYYAQLIPPPAKPHGGGGADPTVVVELSLPWQGRHLRTG